MSVSEFGRLKEMAMVKRECERDDVRFIVVDATVLLVRPDGV